MEKKQQIVITALSLAALVLGLMVSSRLWFRLDLTRNKAYTISKVSRELYKEIPDQVRITYYLSDKLSQAHPLPGEIEDLLREYAAHSRGKIVYTRRDPVKAGVADAVERMGVVPQQIQTVEENEASIATVYTGVAIEYLDRVDVLPVVFSLDSLEYDLSSRIRSLIRGEEREAGVIVGDSFRDWNTDYQSFRQYLEQSGFKVRLLSPGDEIPDALPCLFVLGGAEDLDGWALYRIDRYLQGGGKALFALDSMFVDTQGSLGVRPMEDKGLLAMVASYGAAVKPELVLDRACNTVPFQSAGPYGIPQIRMVRYPHWVQVQPDGGGKGHPLTSGFRGLDLFWPSPVELNAPEGVSGEALLTSTAEAWLQTKDFSANPDLMSQFEAEADATRGPETLGVDLAGVFPSWFAGRPKPVRAGSDETLPDLPAQPKPARVIVIGDTDLAGVFTQMTQGTARNMGFLVQAADWLSNDDDIIAIRNRQSEGGRLDRILDPEARAAAMLLSRTLNTVIIPLALIAAGILLAFKRRRRSYDG